MTLFDRVKELAEEQKISIAELEKKLGWSTNVLYKLKNQKPSIERVGTLANHFNVSIDYLLGRTEIKNWELINNDGQEEAKEIADLVKKLKELSPDQLKDLSEILEPILKIIKK
ncbi:helix-turn-helix transcriptional regulator [Bacillus anthracis]|uniref:helix-turn-helix domain-containing protein n=1 Tax=Bacillus anthracis TaxID=1392 RepID=UPI002DB72001|nr:helix-turn-helix transcriptional regulator [Bacillus anthracis]MEB9507238.1 helix-turn-helix transcriptional regulator [Bacillus anthracis]